MIWVPLAIGKAWLWTCLLVLIGELLPVLRKQLQFFVLTFFLPDFYPSNSCTTMSVHVCRWPQCWLCVSWYWHTNSKAGKWIPQHQCCPPHFNPLMNTFLMWDLGHVTAGVKGRSQQQLRVKVAINMVQLFMGESLTRWLVLSSIWQISSYNIQSSFEAIYSSGNWDPNPTSDSHKKWLAKRRRKTGRQNWGICGQVKAQQVQQIMSWAVLKIMAMLK